MDTSDQATPTRRLRTNADKRRIVLEALEPGASVAAVARRNGVNANLLFGWIRLHKQGALEQCREPATLLPVQVTTPTVLPDRTSREVAATPAPKAPPRERDAFIEVALPDGARVRVHGPVDRGAFEAVLAVLRGR